MTDVYEFSEYNRHNLVYNYITMTAAEIADAKTKATEFEKEQAVKKAAAAAAAAQAKAAQATAVPAATSSPTTPPPPAEPKKE